MLKPVNSGELFNFPLVSQVRYDHCYLLFTLVFTAICMLLSSVLKPLAAERKILGFSRCFSEFLQLAYWTGIYYGAYSQI